MAPGAQREPLQRAKGHMDGLCLLLGGLKPAEGSWEHRAVGMSRCEVYSGKGKMCIIGGKGLFLPR